MLGIYDVAGACIHYYDSLHAPADHTRDAAQVYLKETVKRLNAKHRPGARVPRFEARADSTYAKQTDGTSCGFFVCYYAEAYPTLRQSTGFFMADAQFIHEYRRHAISVLLNVSVLTFPEYIPLVGFTGAYSRTPTQRTPRQAATTSSTRSTQAAAIDNAIIAQAHQSKRRSHDRHACTHYIFLASTAGPSTLPQPPTQNASRLARVSKDLVESLVSSMQFKPFDTAHFPAILAPRAMFMYLRAIASLYQLPIAVASPLLALQKVLGKNSVRDVGPKLHKPRAEAHYVLVPYAVLVML